MFTKRLLPLALAILALCACSSEDFLNRQARLTYRADVCGQYLSPESTTPNYAGRGRSCAVQAADEENDQ